MKTAKTLSWLVALGGLWEIGAPYILKYSTTSAALWDAIIIGIVLVSLGAWAAFTTAADTIKVLNWTNAALGLWLVVAPFILGYTAVGAALWNDIIIGVVVLVLAAWAAIVIGTPRPTDHSMGHPA